MDLFSSGINLFKTFQAEQELSDFLSECVLAMHLLKIILKWVH